MAADTTPPLLLILLTRHDGFRVRLPPSSRKDRHAMLFFGNMPLPAAACSRTQACARIAPTVRVFPPRAAPVHAAQRLTIWFHGNIRLPPPSLSPSMRDVARCQARRFSPAMPPFRSRRHAAILHAFLLTRCAAAVVLLMLTPPRHDPTICCRCFSFRLLRCFLILLLSFRCPPARRAAGGAIIIVFF